MSRLVTFGCSHTFGEGLDIPSQESWPAQLSILLGLELVNKGIGGCSNRLIQHKVFNFNFNEDDLVIILWTYSDRYHFLVDDVNTSPLINVWSKNKLSEYWYKYFHNTYNEHFDNKTIVNQVNLFLKEKKIKVYNMIVSNDFSYYYDKSNLNKLNINFENDYLLKYEKSKDGWHMGKVGHKEFSKKIFEEINGKEIL